MILSANAGGNDRFRVKFEANAGESVWEGIAYGMLLTFLFDDQTEFDGFWLFDLNDNNVMHWRVGAPGELIDEGRATDAEADMALAAINACVKKDHVNNSGALLCNYRINSEWETGFAAQIMLENTGTKAVTG